MIRLEGVVRRPVGAVASIAPGNVVVGVGAIIRLVERAADEGATEEHPARNAPPAVVVVFSIIVTPIIVTAVLIVAVAVVAISVVTVAVVAVAPTAPVPDLNEGLLGLETRRRDER
jgi:hypothetical protein